MKFRIILLCLYLVVSNTAEVRATDTYIRSIRCVRLNVFDKELKQKDNFIYRLANRLHAKTRERVIRREIPFNIGDRYDSEALNEGLRNIRALEFIGEANTQIVEVGHDSVDLILTSEDLWTTVLGLSSEVGGGDYNVSAFADEKNIAGLGIGLETTVQYASDKDNGFSIHAFESRLFDTRITVDLWLARFTYANEFRLNLSQPLYSLKSRWAVSSAIEIDRIQQRLYRDGDEYFRYKKNIDYWALKGIRVFGLYTRAEPYLEYMHNQNKFTALNVNNPNNAIIPKDETFGGPGAGIKFTNIKYSAGYYLDQFGTTEDLKYHYSFDAHVIRSGEISNTFLKGELVGCKIGIMQSPLAGWYLGIYNTYSHYRLDSRRQRIINQAEAIVYYKPAIYHLLALHYLAMSGWRQKDNFQFVLGGENGLRGYPNRYFDGTKTALFNGEYRIFSPYKILTVGLGAVVFFDAGYVWKEDQTIRLRDLKRDVGFGLRFGLTKSSTARTVRIDFAWALDRKTSFISLGTGNVFDLGPFQ